MSDPLQFNPERWFKPDDGRVFSWIPFGIGARACIGQKFANMELRAVLAKLYQHFTFEFDDTKPFVTTNKLTFGPVKMYLRVLPRK